LSPASLVAAVIALLVAVAVAVADARPPPFSSLPSLLPLSHSSSHARPRRSRRRKAGWCIVIIALATITLFVACHPRCRRHCKADCCIIVTVASWIEVVIIIASPPS
jgi:hypothetical protein